MEADIHEFGPVHQRSGPNTMWTTINASEQIPGVLTPLAFTFWINCSDPAVKGTFHALGVLSRGEVRLGDTPDDRMGGAFFGRWVANVDVVRRLADLTPGVSGAAFERDVLHSDRPEPLARARVGRLPWIAIKAPLTVARLPRAVHHSAEEIRTWWRWFTSAQGQARPAVDQLREALERTRRATTLQMLAATVGQGMFGRLGELSQRAGRPDLYLKLCSGYGESEETRMITALYDIALRGGTVEQFLHTYGARCPAEVDLAAHSYRENPAAVEKLVEKYRRAENRGDPAGEARSRVRQRIAAERELLAALPAYRRPAAKLLLLLARTYIPLREEGKSVMVTAIDGGRSAARARGRELVAAASIRDVEDVFYLTLDEVLDDPPPDAQQLVEHRRAQHAAYQQVSVPVRWIGNPEPVEPEPAATDRVEEVTGLAAAPGIAEGTARVILDAEQCDDLEPDEILVCRTTDPSWASAFHLASAVVIDVGGLASHGAIVCREMGLPCVISTGTGTSLLRTGDTLRVDGSTGRVTVLQPA